jgi:hypothetical protein
MKKQKEKKIDKPDEVSSVPHPSDEEIREEEIIAVTEDELDRIPDEEDIYDENEEVPPPPAEGP